MEDEKERASQQRITELTELQAKLLVALNQKGNKGGESQLKLESHLDQVAKELSGKKSALRKLRRARKKKSKKRGRKWVHIWQGGAPQ